MKVDRTMSSPEIWYFLKGQETVGPFSKDLLRQIHADGQLSPETLVWREGMPEWVAASSIEEFEFLRASAPPPAPAAQPPPPVLINPEPPEVAAPESTRPKLKLKDRNQKAETEKSSSPSTATVESPTTQVFKLPPPIAKPVVKKFLTEPHAGSSKEDPSGSESSSSPEEPPKKSSLKLSRIGDRSNNLAAEGNTASNSLTRSVRQLFTFLSSSGFLTSAFLISAAVLTFLFYGAVPNAYWFAYLIYAFGVLGLVRLIGASSLDEAMRILSFAFLIPPMTMIWDVIMSDRPVASTSVAEWAFLCLGMAFCMVIRIGYRIYASPFMEKGAFLLGLLILGFIAAVGTGNLAPAGWKELAARTDPPRLPLQIALAIGKPEWAATSGTLRLNEGGAAIDQVLKQAVLKRHGPGELRLHLKTDQNLVFYIRIHHQNPEIHPPEITAREYPVYFSEESLELGTASTVPNWEFPGRIRVPITNATCRFSSIEGKIWNGSILLKLAPQGANQEGDTVTATFSAKVREIR
jgi:hypothetical protein